MDGSNIEAFCIIEDNDTSISEIPEDVYVDVYDISGHAVIKNGRSDQVKALLPGIYIILLDGKSYKFTKGL